MNLTCKKHVVCLFVSEECSFNVLHLFVFHRRSFDAGGAMFDSSSSSKHLGSSGKSSRYVNGEYIRRRLVQYLTVRRHRNTSALQASHQGM